MDLNLKNKNALVCGSSKGIGKAAALELAELGANITLVSRTASKMAEIIHQLDRSKGQLHDFFVADFTNSRELEKKIKRLVTIKPIHILINNTGGPPSGKLVDASMEEFEIAFHNHLLCNHVLATSVLPGMKKMGYGRIINVISTSVKQPIANLGVSNTIRGAVGNWSKTLAGEVGVDGITVNNVLPGFTKTGRLEEIVEAYANKFERSIEEQEKIMKSGVPLRRFCEPSEVAAAIAFLASPAAGYISGTNLVVDGGRTKSL